MKTPAGRGSHLCSVTVIAAVLTAGAGASAQELRWECVRPTVQKSSQVATFDSGRGVLVLWTARGETMEWDGADWRLKSRAGPPWRPHACFAYDARRGVTVMYGGGSYYSGYYDSQTYYHGGYKLDMWEWDGRVWTERSAPGPSHRERSAFAYDAPRGVFVLHGGYYRYGPDNNADAIWGDTWEWDGSAWREVLGAFRGRRLAASLCVDEARGTVLLAGGDGRVRGAWNLQEWNPATGAVREVAQTPAGVATMVFDRARGVAVATASRADGLSDTWEWDGAAWRLIAGAELRANVGITMVYDTLEDAAISLGGISPDDALARRSGLARWTGERWASRVIDGPLARQSPAAVFDPLRGEVVLIGGLDNFADVLPDDRTWLWRDGTWRAVAEPGPFRRFEHAACFDAQRGVVLAFGGRDTQGAAPPLGDTWTWDGRTWTQAATTGPSPRSQTAMAFDRARGVAVLFGGWDGRARRNDTWEWDGASWTRRFFSGLPSRSGHTMVYDERRHVIVCYGGVVQGSFNQTETYEYDGVAWTRRSTVGPGARVGHAMVYDAQAGVTRLWGGDAAAPPSDVVWNWDGTVWTPEPAPGPARGSFAAAYLPDSSETFMFGGVTTASGAPTSIYSDVWLLGRGCGAPVIIGQPASARVCGGTSVELSVSASGPAELRYQWRAGTPPRLIPGAVGPTLVIPRASLADAGVYECVVTSAGPCLPTTVTTDAATVTVCVADFNCDGTIGLDDYAGYLRAYEAGEPSADVNGDGFLDFFDHDGFVAAFEAGC